MSEKEKLKNTNGIKFEKKLKVLVYLRLVQYSQSCCGHDGAPWIKCL